jgi:hypothetical protein
MKTELQKTVEAIKDMTTDTVTGHDMHVLLKALDNEDIYEDSKHIDRQIR